MRRPRSAPAIALAAVLLAGCRMQALDPEPVPGREARTALLPGAPPATAEWPDAYRRGAVFVVENRTGADIQALVVDLGGKEHPRELVEAEILDPPGRAAEILFAPHGTWPLRARLGTPGTVLLRPGESLRFRLVVDGKPGFCKATITVPGVTEE